MAFDGFIKGGDINAVIADIRKSFGGGPLKKATVNVASGLINYDLQAPSKALFPVNTPLRNKIPRVKGNGDKATHWVAVTAIVGSGWDSMGYVAEGARAGQMTLTTSACDAPYTTLGEEASLSYEAWSAAEGFEDEKAKTSIRLLQKMMLKEENSILGGNYSMALGAPAAPTVVAASTLGTIAAGTYKVNYVALTYEGYRNWLATGASIATGVPTQKTVTGPDGKSMIINGGTSNKSTQTTAGAITGPGTLAISAAPVPGALAYGWFVDNGASGASTLQAVTTLNSILLTALTTTGQALTAIAADYSANQGGSSGGTPIVTAMDGLLYAAIASSQGVNETSFISGAYFKALATGTAGTGTQLTASSKGTVNEIDAMLKAMWDNFQVSPTVIYMNSQQIQDVTTLCLNTASSPLLRVNVDSAEGYTRLMAGGNISFYFNPFTQNGGTKVPVIIHPFLPPGTIIAWAENLPIQYESSEVPNVCEVHYRRDYYQIDWPAYTREFQSGVYSEETLAVYFPPAMGIITNIAPGATV